MLQSIKCQLGLWLKCLQGQRCQNLNFDGFVGYLIAAFVVTPEPGSQCHSGCVEPSKAGE
jgi:hypothetical protein